jgi:hypothetical protein
MSVRRLAHPALGATYRLKVSLRGCQKVSKPKSTKKASGLTRRKSLISKLTAARTMSKKYNTHIQNTLPDGFTWQVIVDGEVLKSGGAKTKIEAISAAEKAARELETEDGD